MGLPAKKISPAEFSDMISTPTKSTMSFKKSMLRYFSNENEQNTSKNTNQTIFDTYFLNQNTFISKKNTQKALTEIGLEFPGSDKKMLTAYLQYIKNE